MLGTLKRIVTHVCTPDELDMIEHYQTRAERLADLWVHGVGLVLAAVGGIVLAGTRASAACCPRPSTPCAWSEC